MISSKSVSDHKFYSSLNDKIESAKASPKLGQLHDIKKLSIVKRWGTLKSLKRDLRKEIILSSDSEQELE